MGTARRPRTKKWPAVPARGTFLARLAARLVHRGGRTGRRSALKGAAFGLAAGLGFLLLWLAGLLQPIEHASLDLRFSLRALLDQGQEPAPVTVVAIDDAAVAAFGRWPWPRGIQADVISAILAERPSVLGIDVVYSSPSEDFRSDLRLSQSLNSEIPIVLAASTLSDREQLPLLSLLAPNVYTAHADNPPDRDGVVRRLPLTVDTSVGTLRSLSWEMARRIGAAADPLTEGDRFLRINYRLSAVGGASGGRPGGPGGTGGPGGAGGAAGSGGVTVGAQGQAARLAPTISVVDVVSGTAAGRLRGRPVILGVTSGGVDALDRDLTSFRGLGPVPGVYVHAAALSTLLREDYVRMQPLWMLTLALGAGGIVAGAVGFVLRPWPATLALVVALAGTLGYALWRFVVASEWVVVVPSALLLVTAYIAGLWHAHVVVEREARLIRDTFRRYVAPEVVDELLARPGAAEMAGGRRAVTVLFADIRGFTTFAERHPPEVVVRHLNGYLSLMYESVLAAGGMVDKFVGDGMMALFGAPLPMANHAEAALRAGVHLLQGVARECSREGAVGLMVGIGIHSGEAVVGSVGSPARLEYTAIGDTVNVASRLQEHARPGTIIVSAATHALLPPPLAARGRRLPPVTVRGRSEAVVAYEYDLTGW